MGDSCCCLPREDQPNRRSAIQNRFFLFFCPLVVAMSFTPPAFRCDAQQDNAFQRGLIALKENRLEAALDEKIASATAQGLRVHIVSQFSFSPDRVLTWLRHLRGSGIAVPVKVGMAGPTSVRMKASDRNAKPSSSLSS